MEEKDFIVQARKMMKDFGMRYIPKAEAPFSEIYERVDAERLFAEEISDKLSKLQNTYDEESTNE